MRTEILGWSSSIERHGRVSAATPRPQWRPSHFTDQYLRRSAKPGGARPPCRRVRGVSAGVVRRGHWRAGWVRWENRLFDEIEPQLFVQGRKSVPHIRHTPLATTGMPHKNRNSPQEHVTVTHLANGPKTRKAPRIDDYRRGSRDPIQSAADRVDTPTPWTIRRDERQVGGPPQPRDSPARTGKRRGEGGKGEESSPKCRSISRISLFFGGGCRGARVKLEVCRQKKQRNSAVNETFVHLREGPIGAYLECTT